MADRPIDLEECVGRSQCSAEQLQSMSNQRQSGYNRYERNKKQTAGSGTFFQLLQHRNLLRKKIYDITNCTDT